MEGSGVPRRQVVAARASGEELWRVPVGEEGQAVAIGDGELAWEQVDGWRVSEEGSGGVVFVGFGGDGVAVVKASGSVAADAVAAKIGEMVGLNAPATRLVALHVDAERAQLAAALKRTDANTSVGMPSSSVVRLLRHPMLTLAEYVVPTTSGVADVLQRSPDAVADLGAILMFDVLVRNADRSPLLMDHGGNAGNMLVGTGDRLVAIDNSMSSLEPGTPEAVLYLDRVRALLGELAAVNGGAGLDVAPELRRVFVWLDAAYGAKCDGALVAGVAAAMEAARETAKCTRSSTP
ncbi:uncharacterized protein AMSG_05393 [Thecamonas trahens ATCC 50062]|uniref:Actin-fragmin kinase catalytic domain-containing protein n=1 Tax=Thecamonas trahens ATCC 50062 TaxID=461836 RepID=A0A0L0DDJ9_THETB|nr:hypothetical protein AMSG_05393 [Thecamonas trahens ATCC 50062]KNC49393.1 hypothetical protein AMSG_05393 [Thecamonas trahens ATCC 50062]|eukprot:XP_013757818.1 hypothetical protein AMSG_05393 [Thecamonas trahens ATCC 50062]